MITHRLTKNSPKTERQHWLFTSEGIKINVILFMCSLISYFNFDLEFLALASSI